MPLLDPVLAALASLAIDTFTIEDMRHALWARGDESLGQQPGTFTEKLLDAAAHADHQNLQRLEQVYPVVMAFELAGHDKTRQLLVDRVREYEAAVAATFNMPAPTEADR